MAAEAEPSSALHPACPIPDLLQGTDLHQMGPADGEEPFSRQCVVLLAEENEDTIEVISEYLQHQDCRLIVARNGREAVDRARSEQPDLILMDIQMPHMDGLEATQLIRAERRLKDVPIIATTALAMPGDRSRFLAAGMNGYISKPFSLKALKQTIEIQLHQEGANPLHPITPTDGGEKAHPYSSAGQRVAMKAGRR
jgi:CheY-like chemotaxis protein